MSNSQSNKRSRSVSNSHSNMVESDSETIQQSNTNYEYLLNELKMKSSALAKASNLIEILQLELQVEKNSKKQAVEAAQQEIKDIYESEIRALREKVQILESVAEKRKMSLVLNTQIIPNATKPRHQSRLMRSSSFSRTLNRSQSKENRQSYFSPKKDKQECSISLQTKMYRKMLLENSIWDQTFIQQFQKLIKLENNGIENYIEKLEQSNQNFEKEFYYPPNKSKKTNGVISKFEEMRKVIQAQNLLIQSMKVYQKQLEDIINGVAHKLGTLYQSNQESPIFQNEITQVSTEILQIVSSWKKQHDNKVQKLKEQNKELRDIVEEMIALMNKKKGNSSRDIKSMAA